MSQEIVQQKGAVRLVKSILTDGSEVFDVEVGPVTFYVEDAKKASELYTLVSSTPFEIPNEDHF